MFLKCLKTDTIQVLGIDLEDICWMLVFILRDIIESNNFTSEIHFGNMIVYDHEWNQSLSYTKMHIVLFRLG